MEEIYKCDPNLHSNIKGILHALVKISQHFFMYYPRYGERFAGKILYDRSTLKANYVPTTPTA